MPTFNCDFSQRSTPFAHVWEHTVGSDHAPIALRADWQTQLRQCRADLGFLYVRFHGLLSDDMGTLICHREELLYSFFNVDQIIDFLLSIGMRPFVELSFMPATLASGSATVFRYRGNVTPPRDYDRWATLIDKIVRHWVDRYGIREVRHWYFEVWNEPNLKHFWTGSREEYFTLYRRTVTAIKNVDASLRVGGPATAQSAWIPEFVEFCQQHNLPADFVSTHYYPTDAFGEIGADTETQLANAPRDVMSDRAADARRQAGDRPLFYTEWNVSSNPRDSLHDQPFAAAYVTRILMNVADLVQGYSFWTFSDIFAENYFPSVPFHGGFGLLTLHGIPKPMYRAFELLRHLGTGRLRVQGAHDTVDAWVVRQERGATVLITNHAPPRQPIATELVRVQLTNAPDPRTAYVERIDETHANPHRAWVEMGEPEYPRALEVEQLKAVSRVVKEPVGWKQEGRTIHFDLDLRPHSVAAITIEFLDVRLRSHDESEASSGETSPNPGRRGRLNQRGRVNLDQRRHRRDRTIASR
jgi:xylan 1,4-beta-xylosidase